MKTIITVFNFSVNYIFLSVLILAYFPNIILSQEKEYPNNYNTKIISEKITLINNVMISLSNNDFEYFQKECLLSEDFNNNVIQVLLEEQKQKQKNDENMLNSIPAGDIVNCIPELYKIAQEKNKNSLNSISKTLTDSSDFSNIEISSIDLTINPKWTILGNKKYQECTIFVHLKSSKNSYKLILDDCFYTGHDGWRMADEIKLQVQK